MNEELRGHAANGAANSLMNAVALDTPKDEYSVMFPPFSFSAQTYHVYSNTGFEGCQGENCRILFWWELFNHECHEWGMSYPDFLDWSRKISLVSHEPHELLF
jgi:hypothetical protein